MTDIQKTLAERGARYGRFDEHAKISQGLRDLMRGTAGWQKLAPDMRQCLETIADKIARILNGGDPEYADNWHDIAGYASLVDQRINQTGIYAAAGSVAIDVTAITASGPFVAQVKSASADDWIEWPGGECPVDRNLFVDVKYRKKEWSLQTRLAGALDWAHHKEFDSDIVAYRVTTADSRLTDN